MQEEIIKLLIINGDGIKIEDCFNGINTRHYRSLSLFKSGLYQRCRQGIIKGFYVKDGKIFKTIRNGMEK
jgi:hypothetical protein